MATCMGYFCIRLFVTKKKGTTECDKNAVGCDVGIA